MSSGGGEAAQGLPAAAAALRCCRRGDVASYVEQPPAGGASPRDRGQRMVREGEAGPEVGAAPGASPRFPRAQRGACGPRPSGWVARGDPRDLSGLPCSLGTRAGLRHLPGRAVLPGAPAEPRHDAEVLLDAAGRSLLLAAPPGSDGWTWMGSSGAASLWLSSPSSQLLLPTEGLQPCPRAGVRTLVSLQYVHEKKRQSIA